MKGENEEEDDEIVRGKPYIRFEGDIWHNICGSSFWKQGHCGGPRRQARNEQKALAAMIILTRSQIYIFYFKS